MARKTINWWCWKCLSFPDKWSTRMNIIKSLIFVLNAEACQHFDKNNFKVKFDKSKCLSHFHLNTRFLSKHLENFNELLSSLDHRFKVIALSETIGFCKHSFVPLNLTLEGYHLFLMKQMPLQHEELFSVCNSVIKTMGVNFCWGISTGTK